jgi:hypothetical protein
VFFDAASHVARERPGYVALNADGSRDVTQLRWTRWGGPLASGARVVRSHGCSPDCGRAAKHAAKGEIVLGGVRSCDGRSYYSHATVYLTAHSERRRLPWNQLSGYAPC